MAESRVVFSEDRCKGCSLCITVCPQKIIYLSDKTNSHGYHPAVVENQASCLSCGLCAQICPDIVISVYRP